MDAANLLTRARALTPLLEAAAPRIEAACALPEDVLTALHEARVFRMLLPRSVGGLELDLVTFFRAVLALAEGDASAAWCVSQSSGCAFSAAYLAPEAARQVFGDARSVVAWGFSTGPHCRAEPVPGGWKASGTWGFGSGNRHASFLGLHCHVPSGGERTMLVPRGAVSIVPDSWRVVGLRGTGSDTYTVKDLFVPEALSLVARATGRDQQLAASARPAPEPERREAGTLYRFAPTNVYQCGFAAVALGLARGMLRSFIALAMTKTPVGTTLALRNNNSIQARVAQSEARLSAVRAWLEELLVEMWRACSAAGAVSFERRVQLRLASTHAIHEARAVTEDCYAGAGATAIFESQPFERRMRDMHAASQQVQASAEHYLSAGQYFLGLDPPLRFL